DERVPFRAIGALALPAAADRAAGLADISSTWFGHAPGLAAARLASQRICGKAPASRADDAGVAHYCTWRLGPPCQRTMILVASYNMRKAIGTDRRRRPERTLEVLNEMGADVIALQEADRRFGERASALPLHLIEEHSDYRPVPLDNRAASIGWHGNALLV